MCNTVPPQLWSVAVNVFVAKELMSALTEAYRSLQKAEEVAKKMEDKEEYVELMKKLLNATGELEDGPILHVVAQHPSLNPFESG